MKKILSIIFLLHAAIAVFAATPSDSTSVMSLLNEAPLSLSTAEYMIYFGKRLEGTPYVAKTLEVNPRREELIINLRQLDCTTFTENVLALSLCAKTNNKTYADFCRYLRMIRYRQGSISYPDRLHYFSSWIEDNTALGFVEEITAEGKPFTAIQKFDINFMSTHTSAYPQLADAMLVKKIAETERKLTGKSVRYIPKTQLSTHTLLKKYIHDGDIIAIVTNKRGLDTSHIGIAHWHADGTLHLLNASQIHKKVIDEPMTLYNYMQKHPSQLGIRVVRVR